MTKPAHTDGPWILTLSRKLVILDQTAREIATISEGPDSNPADANLLVCAPELLALWQQFATMVGSDWKCNTEEGTQWFESMQATVDKANSKTLV